MTVMNSTGTTQTNQTRTRSKFLFSQPDNAVLYDTELCKTAYQLYNILVEMADKKTHQVTVYVKVLADRLGRSPVTTTRHLSTLANLGIIIRKFNKSKTNPKVNEASTFIVVGRHAKRYEYSEYAGDYPSNKDQKRQYPTVKNDTQKPEKKPIRDYLEDNLKGEAEFSKKDNISPEPETPVTPTASISTENPEKPKPPIKAMKCDLSDIPEAMRPIAEYLLMKTNRPTIRDSEREILRELDKHHTTARLLKEIDTCCRKFADEGKDIQQLTFNYIRTILANQPDSRKPKKKAPTGNTNAEISAPNTEYIQETLPDIASEIMPIEEAKKVISEHTPAIKEQEGIPAALEDLYDKIDIIEQENTDAFIDRLPLTEEGLPDWNEAERNEDGSPKIPQITIGEYLRLKFPEAEEEELRTDNVKDKRGLEEALRIDRTCALCCSCDGSCSLCDNGERPKGGRPIVVLKNHKLEVRYTTCIRCKHDKHKPDPAFETRVKRSGLSEKQKKQTFASYGHEGMPDEIVSAKAKAILSAKNGTSLILAGKAGTGKTHLAAAIALEVMRGGKQALFISMPELLNEMRKSYQNHDFNAVRQKFYDVPCLVLDDLGKEKATEKGVEYLYQIIDYRYRHGMQTIATTNALDMNGLLNALNANVIEPLVSRIMENGEWVTIRTAKNYRYTKKLEPKNPVVEPADSPKESNPVSAEKMEQSKPEEHITANPAFKDFVSTFRESFDEEDDKPKRPNAAPSYMDSPEYKSMPDWEKVQYQMWLAQQAEKAKVQAERQNSETTETIHDAEEKTVSGGTLSAYDEDLWEEDEDEYRLYGDTGINGKNEEDEADDDDEYYDYDIVSN